MSYISDGLGDIRNKLKLFFKNVKKGDYYALLLILFFILIFFKPVAAGDGFMYFSILEGAMRDRTLDLQKQLRFNTVHEDLGIVEYNNVTKKVVSSKPPGFAMLSAPLYSLSLLLDNFEIFHVKDDFFLRERKGILIHQASMPLTTLIFIFVGLLLTLKILQSYVSTDSASLAVLLVFFSTPILRYATYDSSYTHGVEMGIMSLVVFLILKDSNPITIGALIGVLFTIRYTSGIFLLPIGVYYIWKKRHKSVLKLALGVLPFLILISLYWNVQFGSFLSSGEAGAPYLLKPEFHIHQMLFDLDRGIIFWTPNILLVLFGLYFFKNDKRWLLLGLIFSYFLVYGITPFWHSNDAFGNRYFVVFFPIFAIGMASLIENEPRIKPLLYLFAIYTMFIFLLHMAYPRSNYTELLDFWFIQGNLVNLPQTLFTKIGIVRFFWEIGLV